MTMTRFAFGAHIYRDGQRVVEVFEGDKLMAALYPAEHGIKIVSRHFDVEGFALDATDPPALVVQFAGSEPPGRERLGNGPIVGRDDTDE